MKDTNQTTTESPADQPEPTASTTTSPQDAPETSEPTTTPPDAPEAAEAETGETAEVDTHQGKVGAEAARYRVQLREAEAKVAELTSALDAMRRAEVGRILTDHATGPKPWAHGVNQALLFASGTAVGDLLDDDGAVDPAKVAAAVTQVREQFGIRPAPLAPPAEGNGSDFRPAEKPNNDWAGAFAVR